LVRRREQDILRELTKHKATRLLDLGCGDGERTSAYSQRLKPRLIVGLELSKQRAKSFNDRNFEAVIADLNGNLPFRDDAFDFLISNQVIEHLVEVDKFVSEIHRVGSNGADVLVSTENLSAWENIFALVLGWRPFSCSDCCKNLGNPLSVHRFEDQLNMHIKVPTYLSLREMFQLSGFNVDRILGSGMVFLFNEQLMKLASRIDPRHCRFITMIGQIEKQSSKVN
jgi:SAM-dependent methyltransferase